MKIGIDLDGTLFQTYEKMQERYKRIKGKEFNLELIFNFDLVRNPLDRLWLYSYFRSPENYRNLATYSDAVYTICKLKQFHEVYFLTIRPPFKKIIQVTEETLTAFFDIPITNIIFCKDFVDKLRVMKERGIQVIIEDNINSESIPPDIRIILLRRSWNKTINNARVELVDFWKEILNKL